METTLQETRTDRSLAGEVGRRRTFGIISHPDAGKTTLTEQLLLMGGAIHLAGDVRARKTARYATSDWMAIERERGISVTSSVMQFTYRDHALNLLDTPGHQDFSEDTYRVLTAVDSALMVIDSVKGVESQTKKLLEVCRMRDTPILTFINKLDREGRDPLELLSDIEDNLGIACAPVTWPVGHGARFRGVYHLLRRELLMHRPGAEPERVPLDGPDDPRLDELIGPRMAEDFRFEVQLLEEAGTTPDREAYLAGRQTPVLFGIALTGFGVDDLLETFVELAPPPRPRPTTTRPVSPVEDAFTGLVFKIQANMDPAHRDRIAFLRICSGRFERGMKVVHQRTGKEVRIGNAMMFLAREREGVEEAFAGDIIGIPNHGTIRIGDSFTEKEALQFVGIPSFAPEHFRRVRVASTLRIKQLDKGLKQLSEEGAIQLMRPLLGNDYVLGAVGPLQFDVIRVRLENEYNVEVEFDVLPYGAARWVESDDREMLDAFIRRHDRQLARDADGQLIYLAENQWWIDRAVEAFPKLRFLAAREQF